MAHPVPAAKDAVKALLEARAEYAAVDVRDGQPTELESVTRDMFWFVETDIPEDAWAGIGAQKRRLTFRLGFTLAVIRDDETERNTEDVIWGYLEALMLALKGDYTLGGVVQQIEDVSGRQSNDPLTSQWQSRFDGQITCQSKAY